MIAIIGAGPAGCALACFLAQRGKACIVFDNGVRPDLIVGESLLPGVMPHIRQLGIEQEVAAISVKKYGAAIRHVGGLRLDFKFPTFGRDIPSYAYNIPRPQFDQLLQRRAETLGVRFVQQRALVEKTDGDPERDIALAPESLAAAGLDQHPEMLVDATGRHRLFSRTLNLPTSRGDRDDVAYFAHFRQFDPDSSIPGQAVITILNQGWSWQIQHRESLSVGVVIPKALAPDFGASPEARLDNVIDANPLLAANGRQRQRISPVKSYSNYQLISQQGYGKGWVLVGDAFGFVDPMLSPGVFMSMESAALLDRLVFAGTPSPSALAQYTRELADWHRAWDELIAYLYDGRLLSLFEVGKRLTDGNRRWSPGRILEQYIRRNIGSLASGVGTRSAYRQKVLHYAAEHMVTKHLGEQPSPYRVEDCLLDS